MHDTIDRLLAQAVDRGDVVGASAALVTPHGVAEGAAGQRAPGAAMTPDTVVYIASMTKAITTAAAMQLVEQGRLELDAPCGDRIPHLGAVQVLDGFTAGGEPVLRPPKRPITLRHLLTHTAGFGYDFTDPQAARYISEQGVPGLAEGCRAAYEYPLSFDPGERWSYGTGIDWAGMLIEAVTGARLDRHLQAVLFDPLGMPDTCFGPDASRQPRTAAMHARTPDGLVPIPWEMAPDPEVLSGGGGLYSTVTDYLRFVRMLLGGGQLDGVRVLQPSTVERMARNHIGDLDARGWQAVNPAITNDVNFFPGMRQHWGLSFLINTEPTPEGRPDGSLSWAGIANTYFWIDRANQVGGVFATQILPFFDARVLGVFRAFERAVYDSL